jgi:hypothetical protein
VAVLLARQAGPGSPELRQCYSYLGTLQKLCALEQAQLVKQHRKSNVVSTAADAAVALLGESAWGIKGELQLQQQPSPALSQQQQQPLPALSQQQQQPLPALSQQQQQRVSAAAISEHAAISFLPSLVIVGRLFLSMAEHMTYWQPLAHLQQQEVLSQPDEQQQQQQQQQAWTDFCFDGAPTTVEKRAVPIQLWLGANHDELAAAGYPSGAVLQQLQQLLAAQEVQSAGISGGVRSIIGQQASINVVSTPLKQLRQAGLALCSLAVPCLCNNPGCANTTGPTELSLVSGRSCICAGCQVARYCSRACQSRHWKQHKPVCVALVAAAAPAVRTAAV